VSPRAGITGYIAAILICIAAMGDWGPFHEWVEVRATEAGIKLHSIMYQIDATGCKEGQRHKPDGWVNRCGFAEPK